MTKSLNDRMRMKIWMKNLLGESYHFDIYHKCNVDVMDPVGYEKAAADKKWIAAMKMEIKMIEKN